MNEHKFAEIEGDGAVRRVVVRNRLKASIDVVWEAITNPDQLQHWWPDWKKGGSIEKREGGRILLGDGSWIDGTIKVWSPPHVFEFTWNDHQDEGSDWFEGKTKSTLRIDLVQVGDETALTLVQFMPSGSEIGGAAGWHQFAGERLSQLLEGGQVVDDPSRFAALKRLYEETT